MYAVANSEVLADDWLPPVAIGREREVLDVVRRLDAPCPRAAPPWVVGVAGPPGSGTSFVARRAALETVERLRRYDGAVRPRLLRVPIAFLRGAHGVATALLQRFDEGFDGRGFPTAEILAGALRRLRRDGRPTVLVLDDVGVGGPDLAPLLRGLCAPDRFLPEGEVGLPPVWTILAGTPEGLTTATATVDPRVSIRPFVTLAPYSAPVLRTIVRERIERACARPPPAALVERIVATAVADGLGARRAVDLVRRELLGGRELARLDRRGRGAADTSPIDPRVVRAIGAASHGSSAAVAEVRRCEAALAARVGRPPLPTTTLWRRLVRLERAGYVRREIRTGGSGGTRSTLRLLAPIAEWVTDPSGTPPASVAGASGRSPRGVAVEDLTSSAMDAFLEG